MLEDFRLQTFAALTRARACFLGYSPPTSVAGDAKDDNVQLRVT
jgi:hypothetical protein